MTDYDNDDGRVVHDEEKKPDAGTLAVIQRAEIDGAIATARAFPRSYADFAREARAMVTMDQEIAEACIYSLPRGKGANKKMITGPSARFAEIIAYAFGNSRSGGRVVETGKEYITAQGVFHDLEKNTTITIEVSRRIVDSYGKRYNADMIGVTGNAGIAIAVRNAQLKGIPKALWLPLYEAARGTAIGDIKTLNVRREAAIGWFVKAGVSVEQLLAKLEIEGVEDIGLDELEIMTGWKTALRDGSANVDTMFAPEREEAGEKVAGFAERVQKARQEQAPEARPADQPADEPA